MLIYVALVMVFVLGACVGSLVNVCVYRLPYEKSLLWPGSRCGRCLQPIHWYDNIPLVSYWVLRGRCRSCGQTFSVRYFLVELFTGLAFLGIFCLDVFVNASHIQFVTDMIHNGHDFGWVSMGLVPLRIWGVWAHHSVLFTFLLIVSLCDLNDMEIPLGVTITGTIVGVALSTMFAWPYPDRYEQFRAPPADWPQPALYPWPVWYEPAQPVLPPQFQPRLPPAQPVPVSRLPWGLKPGDGRLGLYTGLAGAAVGMLVLRGVRFTYSWARGREALGLGDADLMMMAGAFIGWQPVVLAFFVAVVPAVVFGVVQLLRRGDQGLPFGPSLAAGVLLTLYLWRWIGPPFWPLLSFPMILLMAAGAVGIGLLLMAVVMRLMLGVPQEPEGPGA
jgi:leader peptidase (prepilin peptidase)/N-methyltransferase